MPDPINAFEPVSASAGSTLAVDEASPQASKQEFIRAKISLDFTSSRVIIPALALLALIAFASSISGDFVHDDLPQIRDNHTFGHWDAATITRIFTHDFWASLRPELAGDKLDSLYYRPIFSLFLMLGYEVAGLSAPGMALNRAVAPRRSRCPGFLCNKSFFGRSRRCRRKREADTCGFCSRIFCRSSRAGRIGFMDFRIGRPVEHDIPAGRVLLLCAIPQSRKRMEHARNHSVVRAVRIDQRERVRGYLDGARIRTLHLQRQSQTQLARCGLRLCRRCHSLWSCSRTWL